MADEPDDEPFAVTAARGFLPTRDPLRRLPTTIPLYAALEALGDDLPKLLVGGNDLLRHQIETRLAPFSPSSMLPLGKAKAKTKAAELERAYLLLSFIAHAYVWGRPNSPEPADTLPEPLAGLWVTVAEACDRPPVLTYSSFNLYNWRRLDPEGPVALGNLCCLNNFLGGLDEEWFRLVHVAIEAQAAPAVAAMLAYAEAAGSSSTSEGSSDSDTTAFALRPLLLAALRAITDALQAIHATLARMGEGCDPQVYYKRVREYMGGWRNNPRLPQGLDYGAAHGGRRELYGETGAQSAIVPAIDAFLSVVHEMDSMREYLVEMRRYTPKPHVAFIERLEALQPPVREVVRRLAAADDATDAAAAVAYDAAVNALATFRKRHLIYADRYIKKPALSSSSSSSSPSPSSTAATSGDADAAPTSAAEVGTGGSDFVPYLEKHHRETKAHLLLQQGLEQRER